MKYYIITTGIIFISLSSLLPAQDTIIKKFNSNTLTPDLKTNTLNTSCQPSETRQSEQFSDLESASSPDPDPYDHFPAKNLINDGSMDTSFPSQNIHFYQEDNSDDYNDCLSDDYDELSDETGICDDTDDYPLCDSPQPLPEQNFLLLDRMRENNCENENSNCSSSFNTPGIYENTDNSIGSYPLTETSPYTNYHNNNSNTFTNSCSHSSSSDGFTYSNFTTSSGTYVHGTTSTSGNFTNYNFSTSDGEYIQGSTNDYGDFANHEFTTSDGKYLHGTTSAHGDFTNYNFHTSDGGYMQGTSTKIGDDYTTYNFTTSDGRYIHGSSTKIGNYTTFDFTTSDGEYIQGTTTGNDDSSFCSSLSW
jgi:hypothetical protein